MKTPKVRHKKLKTLGQGLYLCTDKRATSEKSFEGSAGGGGYEYFGYEKRNLEHQKRESRRDRYITRKASK